MCSGDGWDCGDCCGGGGCGWDGGGGGVVGLYSFSNHVLTASANMMAKLWDAKLWEGVLTFQGQVGPIKFSPHLPT